MRLCDTSRGVFESKHTTCPPDEASTPSRQRTDWSHSAKPGPESEMHVNAASPSTNRMRTVHHHRFSVG